MTTPAKLGYIFPAEWAPHCATWMSWPRPAGISFPGRYHKIMGNLACIVRAIALREDVHINVPNENWHRIAREQLAANGVEQRLLGGPSQAVFFHYLPTNECWCRDHGPAFVVKGKKAAIVDWKFNAWGGKYPPWDGDDAVPTRIGKEAGLRVFDAPLIMEGGSVDFNGRGTILTTSQCLLNKNRNKGVSQAAVEKALKDYYGQQHIVWLAEGIEGDDTDGHIDDLARFITPTTVVMGMEDNPGDPNYRQLRRAHAKLLKARDQDGRPFEVVTLPMPRPYFIEGQRCPATYLNFHFVNGALLVPTFGDQASGKAALAILRKALPRREVVGVDCREIIWGLGSIHCLTQQAPDVPGLRVKLRKGAAKIE